MIISQDLFAFLPVASIEEESVTLAVRGNDKVGDWGR